MCIPLNPLVFTCSRNKLCTFTHICVFLAVCESVSWFGGVLVCKWRRYFYIFFPPLPPCRKPTSTLQTCTANSQGAVLKHQRYILCIYYPVRSIVHMVALNKSSIPLQFTCMPYPPSHCSQPTSILQTCTASSLVMVLKHQRYMCLHVLKNTRLYVTFGFLPKYGTFSWVFFFTPH